MVSPDAINEICSFVENMDAYKNNLYDAILDVLLHADFLLTHAGARRRPRHEAKAIIMFANRLAVALDSQELAKMVMKIYRKL